MEIHHITPFGWQLGPDSIIWRQPTRPIHWQDNSFRLHFDYSTVIYNVFFSQGDGRAVCICPPFLNLERYMAEARFIFQPDNGKKTVCEPAYRLLDRCAEIWFNLPPGAQGVLSCYSPLGKFSTRVGQNYCHLFADKKVLAAKQKDNPLDWISDWINFNQALHNIDAVLIYDNNSTAYSISEMLQHLALHTNVKTLCVASWPYPFGPAGGPYCAPRLIEAHGGQPVPWDSDYAEYAILQDAYLRFLELARYTMWIDIDEIIMPEDGQSVEDKLAASPDGVISILGKSVSNAVSPDLRHAVQSAPLSGSAFFKSPFQGPEQTIKYVFEKRGMNRDNQLCIHSILKPSGAPFPKPVKGLTMRHFKSVNSGWTNPGRERPYNFDKTEHFLDCAMIKTFAQICSQGSNYRYPLQEVLALARAVGACPRPEGSLPVPPYQTYDCHSCPFNQKS